MQSLQCSSPVTLWWNTSSNSDLWLVVFRLKLNASEEVARQMGMPTLCRCRSSLSAPAHTYRQSAAEWVTTVQFDTAQQVRLGLRIFPGLMAPM